MSDVKAGDAVLTQFGTGVITLRQEDRVEVQLWRISGASVASSARGVLTISSVRGKALFRVTSLGTHQRTLIQMIPLDDYHETYARI